MLLLSKITGYFSGLSIRNKLRLLILVTSVIIVLVSAISLIISEIRTFRVELGRDMQLTAKVLTANILPALVDKDVQRMQQILDTMRSDTNIIEASILNRDKKAILQYQKNSITAQNRMAVLWQPMNAFFQNDSMEIVTPLTLDNDVIGFVYLRSDLQKFKDRLSRYYQFTVMVLIGTMFIAYLLSIAMQRVISQPIIQLSAAMQKISQDHQYQIRLRSDSKDEIGVLITGFNEMLEQIELQTEQLSAANNSFGSVIEQLREAKDVAEKAGQAKTLFLARMSHEIRTPMNGVLGMVDLLLNSGLTDQQSRLAKIVRTSGMTLLNIINDLLDFAKIEAGKIELNPAEYDIRLLAEDITEMLSQSAYGKGLEIGYYVDPNITTYLVGDAFRMRQVLINLLGNAIKFTDQGEISLIISLVKQDGATLEMKFEVVDSGVGIDEAAQQRIFEAFSQASEETSRRYGGTGLGLSISKQLVDLLGGELQVKSRPGVGSTFWFTLRQNASVRKAVPEKKPVNRVLIVDPGRIARKSLQATLTRAGIANLAVEQAFSALEQVRQMAAQGQAVDAILVASTLPDMALSEFIRKIDNDLVGGKPPVVIMTPAHDLMSIEDEINQVHGLVLTKPVRHKACLDILEKAKNMRFLETVPATAQLDESPVSKDAPVPPSASGGRATILIAEDNPVNAEVTRSMVMAAGYPVEVVEDGRQAFEAIQRTSYSMILMDGQMPVLDGLEATKAIRAWELREKKPLHVPIIAVSANIIDDIRDQYLSGGVDDFLVKPFSREQLLQIINAWMAPVEQREAKEVRAEPISVQSAAVAAPGNLIDQRVLAAIGDMIDAAGRQDFFNKIIALYIDDAAKSLKIMQEALVENDIEKLRSIAHKLKSGSANIGAMPMSALCMQIEKNPSDPNVAVWIGSINDVYPATRSALLEFVQGQVA